MSIFTKKKQTLWEDLKATPQQIQRELKDFIDLSDSYKGLPSFDDTNTPEEEANPQPTDDDIRY